MKPALMALAIAAALGAVSLVGVAGVLMQSDAPADGAAATQDANVPDQPGADLMAVDHGVAGDGEHNGAAGMLRPTWPEARGSTPSDSDATELEQISRLVIREDADFTPANGVRSGSGTLADPYVIEDYYVTGDLFIADTDACVIVRENYIGGQLTLNWNAQCVWVHHNYVNDLRVNENVRRSGYATGGLIELNKISFIGQIRHYDGEFRNNVVGPFTQENIFDPIMETVPWMFGSDPRVANVDGFNQGLFHHNTFYGSVDLDLHGHHHGTGFFAPHSHYHGGNESTAAMHPHDHTQRWTSVAFTDNVIVDPEGYGLRYEDRNHAGDDRTATSEEEDTLDLDHRHFTHVVLARNVIDGGQIWVDVFNADDQNHYERNPGWFEITDNVVKFNERKPDTLLGLPFFGSGTDWTSAMHIETTKEVEMTITGNQIIFVPAPDESDDGPLGGIDLWPFDDDQTTQMTGISLRNLADSNVVLADNHVEGFYYGIAAARMDELVSWTVDGNEFVDAQYPVYYDDSVANAPNGGDGPSE